MTQFARPIADSVVPDPYYDRTFFYSWNREGCDLIAPLFSGLDEEVQNEDTDYLVWPCQDPLGATGISVVRLSEVTDPGVNTGFQIAARFRSINANSNTRVICSLYQGEPPDDRAGSNNPSTGTFVAQLDTFSQLVGSSYVTWTHNLSEAEAALITNFSDLWLHFAGIIQGFGVDTIRITQAYLGVPEAEPSFAFSQQPSNVEPTKVISPSVTVEGPNDTSVTIALGANPSNATLTGTLTRIITGGVATFNDLRIDKLGTGYTLVASAAELDNITSSPFNVRIGPPLLLSMNGSTWRSVILGWTNNSELAEEVEIERCDGPSPGSNCAVVDTVIPPDDTYTDLIPIPIPPPSAPEHCYRLRARSSVYGYSAYTSVVCQTLAQAVGNNVISVACPIDLPYNRETADSTVHTVEVT